jgi:hypothetical protein
LLDGPARHDKPAAKAQALQRAFVETVAVPKSKLVRRGALEAEILRECPADDDFCVDVAVADDGLPVFGRVKKQLGFVALALVVGDFGVGAEKDRVEIGTDDIFLADVEQRDRAADATFPKIV